MKRKRTVKAPAAGKPDSQRVARMLTDSGGTALETTNKGGAVFFPDYVQQAYLLCLKHNYNNDQLAEHFGVSRLIFARWLGLYPDLQDACWQGRDYHAQNIIEPSLVKRATGYNIEETVTETYPDGSVKTTVKTKHVPGDVSAIKFFLINRLKTRWENPNAVKAEERPQGAGVELDLGALNPAELAELRGLLEKSTHLHADEQANPAINVACLPLPEKATPSG